MLEASEPFATNSGPPAVVERSRRRAAWYDCRHMFPFSSFLYYSTYSVCLRYLNARIQRDKKRKRKSNQAECTNPCCIIVTHGTHFSSTLVTAKQSFQLKLACFIQKSPKFEEGYQSDGLRYLFSPNVHELTPSHRLCLALVISTRKAICP